MAISLGRGLWPLHQPASDGSVKAKDKAPANEGVDNKDGQGLAGSSSSPSGHPATDDFTPVKRQADTIYFSNWPPPSGQPGQRKR